MALPATQVAAPSRRPRPNRSLDVIPVHEAGRMAGVQFDADPCIMPGNVPQDCVVEIGPAAGTEKTFGDPNVVYESNPFGVYVGIECFLNGGIEEFQATARRVLEAGEHYPVDVQIAASLAAIDTVITPAPTTIQGAIGLLEQALAQNVPSEGYIYLSPLLASYAAAEGLFTPPGLDGALTTYLGTPVVILTALTGLVAYASGPINLWRSGVTELRAPDVTHNIGMALVERLYTVTIECGVWSVTAPAPAAGASTPVTPALLMVLGSIPSSPIPDDTDTTLVVNTNISPTDEVYIHYKINSGPELTTGELTEITPFQFVWNVIGDSTTTGDSIELWAVSGTTESNHITIDVI